jgi:processive 1,2-diacylglycerol beta-glucosyltransferase
METVWRWMYRSFLVNLIGRPLRLPLAKKNYLNAKIIIDEFNPDLVITTQTTASAVIAYMKQKGLYKNLFGIAFSDYHFHKFWVYNQADFYLVNIEEQKQALIKLGVEEKKISVVGMTLKAKPAIDDAKIYNDLNIPRSSEIVLLGSGSLGTGKTAKNLLELISSIQKNSTEKENIYFIIVCGKNISLKNEIDKLNSDSHIIALGFHQQMQELYSVASVFITKPGGLTVAESLSWFLPLFVTHWLPGQEELNYEYLSKRHLIVPVADLSKEDLAKAVYNELQTHQIRNSLIKNEYLRELVVQDRKESPVAEAVNTLFHGV